MKVPDDVKGGTEIPIPNSKNELPISEIELPNSQPRRYFDPEKLESLAKSIKEHGILEPLLVRPKEDGKYELVAGERRLKAAQLAGFSQVPVIIKGFSDKETIQIRLIENLQREDLNPLEETEGILELLALRLGGTVEEAAKLLQNKEKEQRDNPSHNDVGSEKKEKKNEGDKVDTEEEEAQKQIETIEEVFATTSRMSWKSFVKNRLPLLKLPEDLLEVLREGKIEYTKAKEINKLKDDETRKKLLEEAIKDNLSLEQIRQKIKELQRKDPETDNSEPLPLKQQVDEAFRQLKKSKVWDDKKKATKLKNLLKQMQELMK